MQNRIAGAVDGGSRVALPGTINGHARRSVDLGPAAADRKLESLSVRFSMTDAQQADLTQLLAAQLNPTSPSYHQWLTPEQFGARFGLSSSDLSKVSAWLTSQGFTITSVARSSTFINFSGTVAQAQQAFGTTIHSVSLNGEEHITNLTDPVLPAAIAGVVLDVSGLNDFKLQPRSRSRSLTTEPLPAFTTTVGGVTSHYIAPGDLYTIYDFPPASSNLNGSGVTIAVMGQTDLTTGNVLPDANITAFRTAAGLPTINLKTQLATGSKDPGVSTNDIDEAHLDVEWSSAAAPSAQILYVYSTDVINISLPYAVDNKVAPIITASYGLCETGWGSSSLAATNQILQMANSFGITFFSSAGDAGAADCDSTGLATEGLNVDFPSSSPYATSAGGTMFTGDVSNASAYWNSSNASNNSSALQYIPEQPWNETTVTGGLTAGGSGGGGASAFFSKPAWQVDTGVPADSSRDVPDVSLNSGAIHDGYVVCSQNSCTNGFLGSNGQPNVFGGTSFVGPELAGILALVEQNLGNASGVGLGNINPTLYGLANGFPNVFHDIITGNNIVECAQGTPNCPSGSLGFNAASGYDQTSGLGSLDVNMLVTNWSNATPTGGGSTIGTAITTTSLTTSNALCAVSSGTKVALSVTVNGATTPSGMVVILVDNVSVGTANLAAGATTGSATASYMLDTTALSSGGHNISAVYSGDSTHAGSKGTLLGPATIPANYPNGQQASFDIVSSTKADFALTPCTGSATAVSVAPGATAAGITFTVTPAAGFTGTVTLTATNNDSMIATPTFTPASISITSASAVTTSFVVKASQTSARLVKPDLHQHPAGRAPWYAAGSGATLACVLLLALPRRRRWGALLAVVISVAALTAVGCGGNTSTTGGGSGGGSGPTTTNAQPGTYTFTITAVSGTLVHSTQVTVTVP